MLSFGKISFVVFFESYCWRGRRTSRGRAGFVFVMWIFFGVSDVVRLFVFFYSFSFESGLVIWKFYLNGIIFTLGGVLVLFLEIWDIGWDFGVVEDLGFWKGVFGFCCFVRGVVGLGYFRVLVRSFVVISVFLRFLVCLSVGFLL